MTRGGEDSQDTELMPVLADEPVVGTNLTRRFRIMLLFIAATLVMTNVAAYIVGRAFAADSDQRTLRRIAALEKALDEDLNQRRARRDAEFAQLRRDACVLAERVQPQDAEVVEMRRRYGCERGPSPVPDRSPSPGVGAPSRVTPPVSGAGGVPSPTPPGPPVAGPPGPSGSPAPPEPEPDDDGLICLPIVGCLF